MCFVWRNSETFVRMGLRNCQQEWLRGDLVDPLNPRKTQDSIFLPLSLEAKGVSSHKRGSANWLETMKCRHVGWERPELCWWPNLGHTLFSLKATEGVRAVGSLGSWRQGGK